MGVANLCTEHQYTTLMTQSEMCQVLFRLLQAFHNSLSGMDYPLGSRRYFRDWTLVLSMANLSRCPANKKVLCESGLLPLLTQGLQNPLAPTNLKRCSLALLQDLSVFIANRLTPQPGPAMWNTHSLLGRVLALIVYRNDAFIEANVIPYQAGTLFESPLRACMTIEAYLERIAEYAACSAECFLIAPVLIGRLEKAYGKALLCSRTVHRLTLTAVMLATKTHDDLFLNNACFAKVGGLSLKEVNAMELVFLNILQHRLEVEPAEYSMCRQGLELLALGGQILTPRTTQFEVSNMDTASGTVVPWPGIPNQPNNYFVTLMKK
eukprot:c52282_g1_i1.p1 GENE.c52282_g1_i1~~c52282_g1_i1.p1  ORF type:complete len:322 (-),score=54.12 c52282_g1_i1:234-1199(-)